MSYIARFFKWMIRGIIHLAQEVTMWIIRQTISFVRFSAPYIFSTVLSVFGFSLKLMGLSLLAFVRPLPYIADEISMRWSKKAVEDGWFPSIHQRTLTFVLGVVAYWTLFAGFLLDIFTAIFAIVVLL